MSSGFDVELHAAQVRNAQLSEMLRESARRTNFWRTVLRGIAPTTVRLVSGDNRHKRWKAKSR